VRSRVSRGAPAIAAALFVSAATFGFAVPAGTAAPALASAAPATSASPVRYSWHNVQVVAGGFVDGLVFSAAQRGLAYARTDIGGAYRWDAAARHWVPLLDFTGFNDWNELGVESIATAPGDAGKVWVATGEYTQPWASPPDGEILRSADQGRSWQVSALPIQLAANQDGRGTGERLAVDPGDERILYLASPANGLWRSRDGGATWAQVTSFPVTSTPDAIGLSFVTFGAGHDGHPGGHRGAPTSTIFVGDATGRRVYESTDAGATWRPIPGEPAGLEPQHGAVAGNGVFYVDYANAPGPNGMTDGRVWKYSTRTGAWTDITPRRPGADGNPAFGYSGLAVDPSHPGTVMVATNDRWFPVDTIYRSTNGGASWEDIGASATLDITASPYLAWGGTPKFGWWISSIAIDPFNPGHAIYGTGATVFGTGNLTAADRGRPTAWSSAAAKGIEETAAQDLLAPAAGPCRLVSAVGDLGGFCHTTLTDSPASGMIAPILSTGTSLAEAGGAPLDIAMVGWNGGDFSADGGATWSAMALPPGVPFGAGAVALSADGSSLVWTPENQSFAPEPATPVRSTDRGATWSAVSGLPAGVMAVADPVSPETFSAFDPSSGTLYASGDGGASFTAQTSGLPTGTGAEQTGSLPQLHTVPGRGGDLWLTGGDGLLYHSTDGGKTFAAVPSVATVATLGFGKAAPGAGYPAIYLVGVVGAVQGIFRSADGGAHWARINTGAQQWGWTGQAITGDLHVYGRVYLATNGRGIQHGDPAATR
jgi:xyloglucan-specific exo-beta-1,4-glucanase